MEKDFGGCDLAWLGASFGRGVRDEVADGGECGGGGGGGGGEWVEEWVEG